MLAHATARGATDQTDAVFRYKPQPGTKVGKPLTRRHLNTLADTIQRKLPWAEQIGVSPHWFRHTAGTAVERVASFAVAGMFLGHKGNDGPSTGTYIKAAVEEVAAAVEILTGERHPLAPRRQDDPPHSADLGGTPM